MPYHHGNLREALVDAGVELAAKDGPEAVTLRAVSRHVGVSHNAAYRHFADHDDLLHAVSARAMTQWSRSMQDRIGAVIGRGKEAAWKRLMAAGRAYVEFAVESPHLFAVACVGSLGSVRPDEDVPHGYDQLSACLDGLVEAGALTPRRREGAEIACWAAVHGFALLVSDGPLRYAPPEDRAAGLERVLHTVRQGL